MSNWSPKHLIPLGLRDRLRPWKHPLTIFARRRIKARAGQKVVAGPFAGMRLEFQNPDIPKLLGSYECEIHAVVRDLGEGDFKTIVNVGAAEGYYAVGLARLLPQAKVHAYEMDEAKHHALRQLAGANGVDDRISIRGACDTAKLGESVAGNERTIVVMDVEGSERVLLDPASVPGLARCWILLELHDVLAPGVSAEIARRFQSTHHLRRFGTRSRGRADFPLSGMAFDHLPESVLISLMSEQRPWPQEWFYLEPRTEGFPAGRPGINPQSA